MSINRLSKDEVFALVDSLDGDTVAYERVRLHKKGDIRILESKHKSEFKAFISTSIEEGHQPGGDLEVFIPSLNQTLVGHHDGIYWLESRQ